jgi:hypothetical protein
MQEKPLRQLIPSSDQVIDEGQSLSEFGISKYMCASFSSYNIYSPATSIGWGVCTSATWGRYRESEDDAVLQRQGKGFRAAGNPKFGQGIPVMGFERGWIYSQMLSLAARGVNDRAVIELTVDDSSSAGDQCKVREAVGGWLRSSTFNRPSTIDLGKHHRGGVGD